MSGSATGYQKDLFPRADRQTQQQEKRTIQTRPSREQIEKDGSHQDGSHQDGSHQDGSHYAGSHYDGDSDDVHGT